MTPSPADFLPSLSGVLARVRAVAARMIEIREPADPAARYPCAIVAVAAAMAVHILLWPLIGGDEPYVTFYAAVVLVALHWGIGPAIVTAVLSGFVAQFFVLPPTYIVSLRAADKIAGWLSFFVVSSIIIGLARVYRTGMKGLRSAQRQLEFEREAFETRVRERTAELEKMQELHQRLMTRLMRSQEEERHRVSGELQDDFSQRLAVFCIELDRLRTQAVNAQELQGKLNKLKRQAERLSCDVRDASYELDYSDLRLGLVLGANALCNRLARQHAIEIRFEHEGDFDSVSETVSVVLYRVLQEALRNALQHSSATQITVSLAAVAGSLEIRVRDTGCGFDAQVASSSGGLGLVDMQERLRQVGGSLQVNSAPVKGTEIFAAVPASRQAAPSE